MSSNSHYFAERPKAKLKLYKIRTNLRGYDLVFYTASGVFSPKRIDRGTKLLIESMIIEDGWKILDLGTGYGPIGIVAAKMAPHGYVIMTDINRRALWLAKLNAKINNVERIVDIRYGYLYEPIRNEKFNTIITNPPQSAGMELCMKIIYEAPKYLVSGGLFQMVFRHGKGGRRLAKLIEETFGNYEILASRAGYRVYVGKLE